MPELPLGVIVGLREESIRKVKELGLPTCQLLRTIEDVGTENLHAKDGEYPTDGRSLGKEKPLGEGRVNFPVLIPKLKSLEREVSGEQQVRDIPRAKEILEPLCR